MQNSNVWKRAMKCEVLIVHGRRAPRSSDLEQLPTLGKSSKQAVKQLKETLLCCALQL